MFTSWWMSHQHIRKMKNFFSRFCIQDANNLIFLNLFFKCICCAKCTHALLFRFVNAFVCHWFEFLTRFFQRIPSYRSAVFWFISGSFLIWIFFTKKNNSSDKYWFRYFIDGMSNGNLSITINFCLDEVLRNFLISKNITNEKTSNCKKIFFERIFFGWIF